MKQRATFSRRHSSGAADIIVALGLAAMLGFSAVNLNLATNRRNKELTRELTERALVQANQAALEAANVAFRSDRARFSRNTVSGAVTFSLPSGPISTPKWDISGTAASNFKLVACTPSVTSWKQELYKAGDVTLPTKNCTAQSATDLTFQSEVKIERLRQVMGKDYVDVIASTQRQKQTSVARAIIPITMTPFVPPGPPPPPPPPPKKSCALFVVYNWNYGCGPGKLQYWNLYIPSGGYATNGAGTYVVPNAQTVLVASGNFSRWNWGCNWGAPWPPANYWDGTHNHVIPFYPLGNSPDCVLAFSAVSPLVVDLSGDGLHLTLPEDGPPFDMQGDGTLSRFAWPNGPENYFLALPDKKTGEVTSIAQLFGNNTPSLTRDITNGFDALKAAARRKNLKRLDRSHPLYARLRLWRDKNANGKAESEELFTLQEKGIVSIDLQYRHQIYDVDLYGSRVLQVSSVQLGDGQTRPIVDLWPAESRQLARQFPIAKPK